MSKLIMMVGLPASGKSTYARELAKTRNAVIVSSDEMREKLYGDVNNQENNTDLFEKVNTRIQKLLSENQNVIFDATNINRKRRVHFIKNVAKADEYHVCYVNTPIEMCLKNDSLRDRKVGYEVIDKMYKTLQVPTELEGWDSVSFVGTNTDVCSMDILNFEDALELVGKHDELFERLKDIESEFYRVIDVPQDSSYHSFSISRHIFHVHQYVLENYIGKRRREMLVASLFHDLGKGHCKSFYNFKGEEKRYASFIGHELVSAQVVTNTLIRLGYNDSFVKYVVDLVQFHMIPMNMSDKVEKRLKKVITEEQYSDLMLLHEADKNAK